MSPRIIDRWQLVLFERLAQAGMFRLSTDTPTIRILAHGLVESDRPTATKPSRAALGHEA